MMGLAHTIVSQNLHNQSFLETHCVGFGTFSDYLLGKNDKQPKDAEWASQISGISADIIRDLAVRMTGMRTLINLSWSTQRQDHGEQSFWMGAVFGCHIRSNWFAGMRNRVWLWCYKCDRSSQSSSCQAGFTTNK